MNKRLIFLPLFFFVCHILLANPSKIIHLDSSRFPEIEELKSTDILFKEFCFIVEDNYKLIAADKEPQLLFFKYIVKDDFFMYRRDELEKNKLFWESTFAYYFGYSPDFLVKSLIGIMYAKKGNNVVSDFATMLLTFWKNYDYAPDYFFFQILIEDYFKKRAYTTLVFFLL